MRSREFTSPLAARFAMGFCKRGCADAWVEFFLARYSIGVCKLLESEVARIYVPTCCCCKGTEWEKEKGKERGKKSGSYTTCRGRLAFATYLCYRLLTCHKLTCRGQLAWAFCTH